MFSVEEGVYIVQRMDGKIEDMMYGEITNVSARQIRIGNKIFNKSGISVDNPNIVLEKITDELDSLKYELDKKKAYDSCKKTYCSLPESNRIYKKGDKVRFGTTSVAIIDEVFDNGKFYGVDEGSQYQVFPWIVLYDYDCSNDVMCKVDNNSITFLKQRILSVLSKIYCDFVDFNPLYQRDYVWDEKDKIDLIDSIFDNIEIGKIVFVETEQGYEVLDGKQRLTALKEFYEDRFKYNGKLYSQLSIKDRNHFNQYSVSVGEVYNMNYLDKLKYFYKLNKKGKKMDESHLNNIKELIDAEQC